MEGTTFEQGNQTYELPEMPVGLYPQKYSGKYLPLNNLVRGLYCKVMDQVAEVHWPQIKGKK